MELPSTLVYPQVTFVSTEPHVSKTGFALAGSQEKEAQGRDNQKLCFLQAGKFQRPVLCTEWKKQTLEMWFNIMPILSALFWSQPPENVFSFFQETFFTKCHFPWVYLEILSTILILVKIKHITTLVLIFLAQEGNKSWFTCKLAGQNHLPLYEF